MNNGQRKVDVHDTVHMRRREFLFFLAKVMIPFAICIILLTILFLKIESARNIDQVSSLSAAALSREDTFMQKEIASVQTEIQIISGSDHLGFLKTVGNKGNSQVSSELARIIKFEDKYDQARVLDRNGIEVARVNKIASGVDIVPSDGLQDKGDRYYLKNALKSPAGVVSVSTLDLNVEHNQIQIPLKPVIRFSLTVNGDDGEVLGVVVLNYLAKVLIREIQMPSVTNGGDSLLLDSKANYLRSMARGEDEWEYLLPDSSATAFADDFPEAWEKISKIGGGTLETAEGLFIYHDINLLQKNMIVSTPEGSNSDYYSWILVHHFSPEQVFRIKYPMLPLIVAVELVFLLSVLLIVIARFRSYIFKKRAHRQLKKMAHFDELTGAVNRHLFNERLDMAAKRSKREGRKFALLLLDLDRFKVINDKYGHAAGDHVLQAVAKLIKMSLRDIDTVGRFGGDEFAVILEGIDNVVEVRNVAEKIIASLEHPILWQEINLSIGLSIGIALYENGIAHQELMKKADDAMYLVKRSGRCGFAFYGEEAVITR
jgi:diguanylate cyclase (GGDEF)-like protein